MKDDQLIQLLQEKTPEELSLEEISLLQRRLAESEELRVTLFEQLEMEQYLAEALGRVEVSLDEVASSRATRVSRHHPILLSVIAVVCLGLIGFISLVIVAAMRSPDDAPVAVADNGAPDEEEESVEPSTDEEGGKNSVEDEPAEEHSPDEPGSEAPSDGEPMPNSVTDAPAESSIEPTETSAVPPADPPEPKGPWVADLAAPPRPFSEAWFVDFDTEKHVTSEEEIKQWFEEAPGESCRFDEQKIEGTGHGAFRGVMKLKAPLPEDAALRFSTAKADRLRIHCYRGEQGVSIYANTRHGAADRWAAYRVTRVSGKHTPQQMQLADTDEGRDEVCDARYGPTLLLRWHEGQLILSRGDIELARAGFPEGPPKDIFFEGEAAFRGIEMLRLSDHPQPPNAWPEPYQVIDRPAQLNWKGALRDGASFEPHEDGSVHLAAENLEEFGWTAAPLPAGRVRFIEVELDDLTPGAQVWLGPPPVVSADGEVEQPGGRPTSPTLRFTKNDRDGRLTAEWTSHDEDQWKSDYHEVEEKTVPYAGPRTWVRFLIGAGWVRCWISPDGENWALLNWGDPWHSGALTHLGIGCAEDAPGAQVTVRQIRLRELPTINGLVEQELLQRARSFDAAESYGHWLADVAQAQPADVDAPSWRIACALRTIATGASSPTMQALLDLLLRSHLHETTPVETQLALLGEVALLAGLHEKLPNGEEFDLPSRYVALARRQVSSGHTRPMTLVRHAMMSKLPQGRHFFKAYHPDLIHVELIHLAYSEQWDEIATFVEKLKFYSGDAWQDVAPLAPWLEVVADRQQPGRVGEGVARLRSDWQNPLVEQYNKEAYNVIAEFHAALESESYGVAAEMIAQLDPHGVSGLVPASYDADLLASVSTVIRNAMAQDAELARMMNAKFAPLGDMRVKKAAAAGDEAAVRLATVQFHGTGAAGLAHRWLGDRALAAGEFVQAIAHYRRALEHVNVLEKRQIEPRMRLAAAMLGTDVGEPPTGPVEFGETRLSAEEFEDLVAEMRATHADSAGTLQEFTGEATQPAPPPSGFQVHRRERLSGEAGGSPDSLDGRVRQYEVPWLARQLGVTLDGSIAYVNNRFHAAAYDLSDNGRRLWQSRPPDNHGRTHEWSLTAMRPAVGPQQVFVRQLTKEGPLLVSLDRENGEQRWAMKPSRENHVLSDPLLAQGKVFALTLQGTRRGEDMLRLCSYAPDTGDLIAAHDLLNVRQSWHEQRVCRATQLPDGLVATLGGFVMHVSFEGNVRWVRRQLLLPASQHPTWVTQRFDRPLVVGERVIIHTPGVRAIECLHLESGRLLWREVLPHVDRLIGVTADNVIVHAGDEYLALELDSGEPQWERQILAPLDAELCEGEHGILLSHEITSPRDANKRCPELVWLDATTGDVTARTALPELTEDEPKFGPLVRHGERIWSFFGNGIQQPHRDVIELQPQGEPDTLGNARSDDSGSAAHASATDPWLLHTRDELREAIGRKFPQWRLLSAGSRDGFGHIENIHNEDDVVALPAEGATPVVLGRWISVPKSGKPRLRLRFGNDPNHHWRLTVRLGEEILAQREIDWSQQQEIWKEESVDLSSLAGRSGWLTIEARHVSHGDHSRTYWKRLDLQF